MYIHGGDIYRHEAVIDFSANINFLGMPKSVKEAAHRGIELCGSYPDPQCLRLRESIAIREGVDLGQIICGNGAADLIFSLVLAKRPKRALVPAPTFYEYGQALASVGCNVERYYLKEEQGFRLQEDFLEQITEDMDMVFVCNPNNPTGILTEPEWMEQILSRCEICDTLLVVDECFQDFLMEPDRYSLKKCLSGSNHLFLLKAFTKMYAMAGLRLGYGLCSHRELLTQMARVRQPWSVSVPAQMAGAAAAAELDFAKKSRMKIQEERELLKQELKNMNYWVLDSVANYLFFQGQEDLFDRCLSKGCLIRDCSNYEGLSKGWYRIAVRSYRENQKLLCILREAINEE